MKKTWLLSVVLLLLLAACNVPTPSATGRLEPEANYWQQLGGNLNELPGVGHASMALDSSGIPVVSWEEYDGTSTNIYVKRWNGSSWVQLGTILDANSNQNAEYSSLALDNSGNPVVAWEESDGTSINIYVKRWTGTAWTNISSSALDKTLSQTAQRPAIVLKTNNNPIVAWDESDGTSTNILVKQY